MEPVDKYSLKELQWLASEYGITTKENGKNKLKKKLYDEIQRLLEFPISPPRRYSPSPPPSPPRYSPLDCHTQLIPTQDQIRRQYLVELQTRTEVECESYPSADCFERLEWIDLELRRFYQAREQFDRELRQMYLDNLTDMEVDPVAPDGNCLYESIRYGLQAKYGIITSIEELKQIAFKYIRECGKTMYQYQFPNGDFELLDRETFIRIMARPGEYGNQEMIQAISYATGIQIIVYNSVSDTIVVSNATCSMDCKVIYVQFDEINHYDALAQEVY